MLRKIKGMILEELHTDQRCRNSDKILRYKIETRLLGKNLRLSWEEIMSLPADGTIKRLRALIQNKEHKYLPTSEEVRRQRRIKEEEYKKYMRGEEYD